jgi:predicted HD phosphohydrolase
MTIQARATYRTMAEGTAQDYALIGRAEEANEAGLVTRVLGLVEALADGEQAYPISRLDHSLQSATRAFEDHRPNEYVVAALLHDIGDTYAPHAHGAFAAAVIAPYVSERVAWIVKAHPEFQQYYYAPHMGGPRRTREVPRPPVVRRLRAVLREVRPELLRCSIRAPSARLLPADRRAGLRPRTVDCDALTVCTSSSPTEGAP